MKTYCVVYRVYGIYYRFRCCAKNKKQARLECRDAMWCKDKDIVEVYEEV